MSDTPEWDRLCRRLFDDPERRLVNFKVTWGDQAHELTREEACAALNASLDRVEAGLSVAGPPVSTRPPVDVRTLVAEIEQST